MIRICFRISRTFAKDLSSGFSIKGLEKVFLVFKVASQMTFLNFELKSDIQNLKRRRPNCGINGGLTLYQINIVWWVVRSWIKVRYLSMIWESVLHTQNVSVRRIENFLQASEVKVFAKNSHTVAGSAELQRLEFQKIHLKVTFPSIKNVSWVVRSWFKMRCISLI